MGSGCCWHSLRMFQVEHNRVVCLVLNQNAFAVRIPQRLFRSNRSLDKLFCQRLRLGCIVRGCLCLRGLVPVGSQRIFVCPQLPRLRHPLLGQLLLLEIGWLHSLGMVRNSVVLGYPMFERLLCWVLMWMIVEL